LEELICGGATHSSPNIHTHTQHVGRRARTFGEGDLDEGVALCPGKQDRVHVTFW
jgi:hypothetical protein